jgi:hypothetical protein
VSSGTNSVRQCSGNSAVGLNMVNVEGMDPGLRDATQWPVSLGGNAPSRALC